jgi:hypothetical protein
MDNSPLDDLLKELETALVKLLESVRGDPWSLLIFQTLIWSFRRWAIHYLVSDDTSDNMHDYLWDSHIDLVKNYAPDGLQEFGVVWLSPANVGDRADVLEELNSYFLFIVDKLNKAIDTNNDDEQNSLSIFLDETLTDILGEWLEGRTEYRIYPDHDDPSDTFSSEKIFMIMQKILEKNARPSREVVVPVGGSVALPTLHVAVEAPAPIPVEAPVPAPIPIPIPAPIPVELPAPVHVPAPVKPAPAKPMILTIAAALNRRRTMRSRRPESARVNATRKRRSTP